MIWSMIAIKIYTYLMVTRILKLWSELRVVNMLKFSSHSKKLILEIEKEEVELCAKLYILTFNVQNFCRIN